MVLLGSIVICIFALESVFALGRPIRMEPWWGGKSFSVKLGGHPLRLLFSAAYQTAALRSSDFSGLGADDGTGFGPCRKG